MTNKLLIRPNPFPQESLLGYIIRLAEINGYENPKEIIGLLKKNAGFPDPYMSRNHLLAAQTPQIVKELSCLTLQDRNVLLNMATTLLGNNSCKFLGFEINCNIIQQGLQKHCPLCLRTAPYHRIYWDLLLITACPIHKCQLVNKCSNCNSFLSRDRNSILQCKCGYDLREMEPRTVPDKELRVTGHILCQFNAVDLDSPYLNLDNPLINFSLKEFADVIYFFMRRVLVVKLEKPFPFKRIGTYDCLHQITCEALSIFDKYPRNYINWLEKIVKLKKSDLRRSINGYFHFYHPHSPQGLPLRCRDFLYRTFTECAPEILERNSKRYFFTQFENFDDKLNSIN